MSQWPPIEPEALDPAERPLRDAVLTGPRKNLRGPFPLWLPSPALADPAQRLGAFLRSESELPARLRELAILVTARATTAQYEWFMHRPLAEGGWITPRIIAAIAARAAPPFPDADEALRVLLSMWRSLSGQLETLHLGHLADARNLELLRVLREDVRMAVSELARRVGLSAPATRERVLRLEEAGVIAGYRLELDPAALGYPIGCFVRVRPAPGQLPKVADLARALPEVVECHRVTGEDCFVLKVHLPGLDQLDKVLDRFLAFG